MNRYPIRGDHIKIGKQFLYVLSTRVSDNQITCIKRNDIGKPNPKLLVKQVHCVGVVPHELGDGCVPLADVQFIEHSKITETVCYTIK